MNLRNPGAQISVPDGSEAAVAVARTSHLAIGAHQDDIPIMAYDGILRCIGRNDRWFLGVTVTSGAGSPRTGRYADYSDEQMRQVRIAEEKKAASLGEYTAAVQLDFPSAAVKDAASREVLDELATIIAAAAPDVVYTHNLADKHDTHVAVALRTIAAIRSLPSDSQPRSLYGCEVWRDLDWMTDDDKVAFDVSGNDELSAALLEAYESQVSGGKRYDLATAGRRLAHATYSASHEADIAESLIYAMDLTPLITNPTVDVTAYVTAHIERMQRDVADRMNRLDG